jgi:hypothetical protein
MRLTGSAAFDLGTPSNRERSITMLRRAVELVHGMRTRSCPAPQRPPMLMNGPH